jgi:hypothetical protein
MTPEEARRNILSWLMDRTKLKMFLPQDRIWRRRIAHKRWSLADYQDVASRVRQLSDGKKGRRR